MFECLWRLVVQERKSTRSTSERSFVQVSRYADRLGQGPCISSAKLGQGRGGGWGGGGGGGEEEGGGGREQSLT